MSDNGGPLVADQERVTAAKATLLKEIGSTTDVRFRNLRDDGMSVCGEYERKSEIAPSGYDKFRYAAGTVMRRSDHERYREMLLNSGHSEDELKAMLAEFDRFWGACQSAGRRVDE